MLNRTFRVGDKTVGAGASPYVIAEIGSNFDQSLDTAKRLIDECADAGADAVKFQLFRAELMYPKGTTLYDIFKSIELSPDWLPELSAHADGCGVHFLASPFDPQSVDCLSDIGVPAMKIASSETTKLGLVEYIAAKNVPIFLSTGMCDLIDVIEAVKACQRAHNHDVALLQCGARYPLPVAQANLRVMEKFRDMFDAPVGFSDHTEGQVAALAAVALGANVIERHVTLDRKSDGPDHFFAMETRELKEFVKNLHDAFAARGSSEKEMLQEEKEVGRREGLYAVRKLEKGAVITADDITKRRPATGIRARYFDAVIGAKVINGIEEDQPIIWSDISPDAK